VDSRLTAAHKTRRRRIEFLDFRNDIVAAHTDTAIHVILDNLNTHKPRNDRWLRRHPNVHFRFTPTRASWLNQVELGDVGGDPRGLVAAEKLGRRSPSLLLLEEARTETTGHWSVRICDRFTTRVMMSASRAFCPPGDSIALRPHHRSVLQPKGRLADLMHADA
jgi:hypothetical protein